MTDFENIKKEHDESVLLTEMTLKSIQVIQGQIQISNQEIQELIDYFKEMEYYVLCGKLKNFMK